MEHELKRAQYFLFRQSLKASALAGNHGGRIKTTGYYEKPGIKAKYSEAGFFPVIHRLTETEFQIRANPWNVIRLGEPDAMRVEVRPHLVPPVDCPLTRNGEGWTGLERDPESGLVIASFARRTLLYDVFFIQVDISQNVGLEELISAGLKLENLNR